MHTAKNASRCRRRFWTSRKVLKPGVKNSKSSSKNLNKITRQLKLSRKHMPKKLRHTCKSRTRSTMSCLLISSTRRSRWKKTLPLKKLSWLKNGKLSVRKQLCSHANKKKTSQRPNFLRQSLITTEGSIILKSWFKNWSSQCRSIETSSRPKTRP